MIAAIARFVSPVTSRIFLATGVREDLQLHFAAGFLVSVATAALSTSLVLTAVAATVAGAAREVWALLDNDTHTEPDIKDFVATVLGAAPVLVFLLV